MHRRSFLHPHSNFTEKSRGFDVQILVAVLLLVIIGLIMVYDSSVVQAYKDYGDNYYYIKQQLIWVVLGFGALTFFAFFNYKNLRFFAPIMFFGSLVLLLAVFIPGLGISAGGAHRWLKLGIVSIQPTEIVKLTSIIFFATLFTSDSSTLEKKKRLLPFGLTVGFICLIIGVLQKDLGSTIVYFFTALAIYVVADLPLKYFKALIPVSLIGFLIFIFSSTYRKQRILAFLDPFSDPRGYSYHISQVLIALGSGGLLGVGIGQSRQKFEYIPEVTTDSIFAIVGEEFGFVGALILIGLISYLIFRGLKISEGVTDDFGRILSYGLISWLGIQAIINLGAMVSLIPLTGVPLPFISYGGSALMANLVAIGILLNISRHSSIK